MGDVPMAPHLFSRHRVVRWAVEASGHAVLDHAHQVGDDVVHTPPGAGRHGPLPVVVVQADQDLAQPVPATPVVIADSLAH